MPPNDKPRILAVDDVQDNLDLICDALADEQYDVLTAGNADEALRLAHSESLDLAILDVQMPCVDGYELCRQLRAIPDTRRLPVIFLTAHYTNAGDAVRGLDLGACDYITKPFDVEELRSRVRAVLRVKREHDEAESELEAHTGKLKVDIGKLHEEKRSLEAAAARSERLAAELEEMQRRASVEPQARGQILAVCGAKGGVGQSVIAANFAIALGDTTKKRVALLDANIQSGDIAALLELNPQYGLCDLLPRADDLDTDLLEAVLVRHSSGIRVIAAKTGFETIEAVEAAPLKKILLALRETLDYLIVDCSPLPGRCALATLEAADRTLLVTTAEVTSVRRAQAFMEHVQSLGLSPDLFFMVLNRYGRNDDVTAREIEEALRHKFSAVVSDDPALVTHSVNTGEPFVLNHRKSKVSKSVFALARSIVESMGHPENLVTTESHTCSH